MEIKNFFLKFLWVLGIIFRASGELPELECPDDCDCHYFRINWVIDCSETNLTDIPTPDEGLSLNVYILNMNGNLLRNITPFPTDIKLRRLQLADNHLTRISREEFAGLGYLLDLDLSGNAITYIEPDAFRDSPGLITLEMQGNPLELIEQPFLVSRSLLYLDLSDCQLTKLTPSFFQNITSLNKLDLSGNPFGSLEDGVLNYLISLEYLKLNRCNLTRISSFAFLQNERIKVLELSENNLKGPIDWLQILGKLSLLEHLDLRRSGISSLPEDVFANNTWLRSLVLAENNLIDLDVATTLGQNLKHLFTVDLSNCHLEGPLSEDAFANATNLRTLILSGNHLSAPDLSVALAPLTKLQKLSLRNCSLTRLPANTFHRFTCLQELDISRNPLNDAFTGLLSPLKSLERLNMGYSDLGRISKTTFSKMTSLRSLILSGNPLSSLESGLFQNLTQLEALELNYCGLSNLNSTVFPDNFTYPDLQELHLAGNPLNVPTIGSFLPGQLRRLRTLDIANCNLTFIPAEALMSFKNITKLLLSGNNLTSSEKAFDFLKNLPLLERLDLSQNKLTELSPNVFKFNLHINAIKLTENPWRCGCHIADLWDWATVVKGDIGVLIGSTTLPEDILAGGKKKKKGLWCHFDSKSGPRFNTAHNRKPGRMEYIDNLNKTWARYVRESTCNSSARIRQARLLNSRQIRDLSNQVQVEKFQSVNEVALNWSMTFFGLTTAVLIISAIFVVANIILEKNGKADNHANIIKSAGEHLQEGLSDPRSYPSSSESNPRRLNK